MPSAKVMMLDETIVGRELPTVHVYVDPERIRLFAESIGDLDPLHRDEAAAQAAGYRGLVAPLTFPIVILMDAELVLRLLDELGVDRHRMLHAEQTFIYHDEICAGDVLTCFSRITDLQVKKNGALQFLLATTRMMNNRARIVCEAISNTAVRHEVQLERT